MISSDAIEVTAARTGRLLRVNKEGLLCLVEPPTREPQAQLVGEDRRGRQEELIIEERGEETTEQSPHAEEEFENVPEQFFFKDFKTKFAVIPDYDGRACYCPRALEVGKGEEWELV